MCAFYTNFSDLNEESSHDDEGGHRDVESVRRHVLWDRKRQEANQDHHNARQEGVAEVGSEQS